METRNTINFEDFISTAIPIWKLLNMTEKQYIEKHWQPLHTNDISNIIIGSNSKKECTMIDRGSEKLIVFRIN